MPCPRCESPDPDERKSYVAFHDISRSCPDPWHESIQFVTSEHFATSALNTIARAVNRGKSVVVLDERGEPMLKVKMMTPAEREDAKRSYGWVNQVSFLSDPDGRMGP